MGSGLAQPPWTKTDCPAAINFKKLLELVADLGQKTALADIGISSIMECVSMPKHRSREASRFFTTASGAIHALATCLLQCLLKASNIDRPPEARVSMTVHFTPPNLDLYCQH